jgi:hypothetical protein
MRGHSRLAASAVVGGLVLLSTAVVVCAQIPAQPLGRVATLASGSIQGVVQDETGVPVAGAMVSALGVTTAFATTDRGGRFELRTLSPGPYLLRAHLSGYLASRGQIVQVRPSGRASSSIALRRANSASSYPVLAAGAGLTAEPAPEPSAVPAAIEAASSSGTDDHGETSWRLRHARRSILKDAVFPDDVGTDDPPPNFLGRAVGSSARVATNFFGGTPFSGQVNLLTTATFDSSQQLFAIDTFSRGLAYVSLGAPVGSSADWTVRGAVTQGDLASWIVAGSYVTRVPARHRYDIGMSYATQRYGGGNPAALRDVTDGSRNAGTMYGFDTFAITPAVSLTYGAHYARYDYLADRSLISPRVALTLVPTEHLRINTLASSRAVAPGAEEFLPPGENGIWLPPQRTFSSLDITHRLQAERTTHFGVELERDLVADSTVSFRVFHQHVADQLATLFGAQIPGAPSAELGHYFVANAGAFDATGWCAGVHTALARRVHASIEYSLARAHWNPAETSLAYLVLNAPSAIRTESERIHDVSAAFETELPETSTRVLVLYRVSNAFARRDTTSDRPIFDGRFDVQVRQALPFMNFSSAHWEMLLAVRNFFREIAADQSPYDELLVVRPPKRVVGGLTLRF